MRSVRFFPFWDESSIDQVVGLLQMVNAVFERRPSASRWIEIGSLNGESATLFLGFSQIRLLQLVEQSKSHAEMLKKKFRREISAGRCDVYATYSTTFAATVEERSVDVVYVDGSHEYVDVVKDLQAFWPKLGPGGFLCGHDYKRDWPGVTQAVDEFCVSHGVFVEATFMDGSFLIRKEG
jgi:predicted O-methyltransferase YrrM